VIQAQHVTLQNPPAHVYVAQATVPVLGGPDNLTLYLDEYPSDTRVVAHARGFTVYEVAALAGAGDGAFLVRSFGMQAQASALSPHQRAANTYGLVRLELTDSAGTQSFSLTGQPRVSWFREGNVYRTSYHHLSLGRFGWAQLWISMRAGTEQLDFLLELHNGIPGPDRRFTSARLVTAALPWRSALPDPVVSPPWLVKPGNYVIPQQFGRPFRFSVGTTSEPEHVGVADWSGGGFLPAAFPVPAMVAPHGGALAEARWRLANLLPSPAYGPAPTGPLWPASGGATQSDEGGGQDRLPLLGARWAAGNDALELYQIEQLRSQCRARRRYALDGGPLVLPVVPTWSFYDGFISGRDAPWEWDRWPQAWSPPIQFRDHGIGSLVRSTNDNLALAWLANDPLAHLYVLESATRARLTFPSVPPCATPGLGTNQGGQLAQAALAIAAARCLGATGYEDWAQQYRDHMRAAQMPSGVFVAREGGYPSANAPFFGRYLLSGGSELALTMLALHELGGADDVVRRCARGLLNLATDDDDPGFYYFFATGPADGSSTRYLSEDDWPQALHDAMGVDGTSGYYAPWDVGFAIELVRGEPEFPELLRRFTNGADPRAWGVTSPNGVPIEQWYPILR